MVRGKKSLQDRSIYEKLDLDGDGIVSDEEMARAREIEEFEHRMARHENEDKKEDQIRSMAWFALWGMLIYPVGIVVADIIGYETTGELLANIAPTYFVAISGLVAAFFGATAYTKSKSAPPPAPKRGSVDER